MNGKQKNRRQISIQAVLVLTLIVATFAAGYRSGHQQSVEFQFQELQQLIQQTVVPDEWEDVGGPGAMAPFPTTISTTLSAESGNDAANETADPAEVNGETNGQDTSSRAAL